MAVRRESVRLELIDDFSTGMARAAASAALLNRELGSLSKDSVRTKRSLSDIDDGITRVGTHTNRSGKEIDQFSGRLRLLADTAAILGPALVPIGAVAVPAVTGLASQLGFATVAAGTAVLAFQGIGEALQAVNKAGLKPTTANLTAAREAMDKLGPDAANLVRQLRQMQPELSALRDAAAAGFLPGVDSALHSIESVLPRVEKIVSSVSETLGGITADAGESLASAKWQPFLDFIAKEAPVALIDLGSILGSTAHALAELWMAFTPLDEGFSTFLVGAAKDFDQFASGLSQTQGFQDFVAYIQENGPQVGETLGAIANAAVQIVQAAAPLGGPVLQGLEGIAKAVGAIADSDLGTFLFTAAAGLSLLNRGLKVTESLVAFNSRLDLANVKVKQFGRNLNGAGLAKSALLLGGLAVAGSGAADSIGLTNTVSLGLAGSVGGPLGAALGTAVGLTLDLSHANDGLERAMRGVDSAIQLNDFDKLRVELKNLDSQLTDLEHHHGLGDSIGDAATNIFSGNLQQKATALPIVGGWLSIFGDPHGPEAGITAKINDTKHALAEMQKPTQGLATLLTQSLGPGAQQVGNDLDNAARAADKFDQSLDGLNGKLSRSQALISYREAVRQLNEVVKQNPAGTSLATGLGKTGAEGDAVRSQLLSIIQLTLQYSSQLNSLDQVGFLRKSRKDILQRATDLGIPLKAVQSLLNSFGIVDRTKVTPRVDTKKFKTDIGDAQTALDKFLLRDHTLSIRAVLTGLKHPGKPGDLGALLLQPITPADGTTVPGMRYPYGDRVPALLSPGEEVISNRFGQADRNRELLKAINDNRMAYGGTVKPFPMSSQPAGGAGVSTNVRLSDIDIGRLAQVMSLARPLYGDVTIQPHNYNEFRRQMAQDQRMAASSGVEQPW